MSRVYFHSPSDTVELRGTERAHASWLTNSIGIAAIGPLDRLIPHIDAGYRLSDEESAAVALRVGGAHFVTPSGRLDAWETLLNTCLAIGNDQLCFMARMHAQCEIHGWIDGTDRTWLADLITGGLDIGMMRSGQGWDGVIEHLRERSDEPVVMSYSVCEQFPHPGVAVGWEMPTDERGEADYDKWHDLPDDDQWSYAMAGIQQMRFGPATLRARFGHMKSVFDVLREIGKE